MGYTLKTKMHAAQSAAGDLSSAHSSDSQVSERTHEMGLPPRLTPHSVLPPVYTQVTSGGCYR